MDALPAGGEGPLAPQDGETLVRLLNEQQADLYAALEFLTGHPSTDASRVAVVGSSFSGIQTVLAST
ncbi:hypothetical protein [Deinococcus hopiensis]|uniref:hypothetical protein n=1 Tax=Deinococcus hopiensis TaxID=309885 RepID=UPI0009FE5C7B|nr:hypothetical protein [Deinococcus hopiensis]